MATTGRSVAMRWPLLLHLLFLPSLRAQTPAFTYRFEWDLHLPSPSYSAVFPITALPAVHPLVTSNICGQSFSAGDAIPLTGLWSERGWQTNQGWTCNSMSGGQMFYGYNYPSTNSGNTGYVNQDAMSVYMVMDSGNNVYLVVGLDAPIPGRYSGARRVWMTWTSTGLAGGSTAIVQSDDNGEVTWNTAAGTGTASWRWVTCCTDGAVIGPMPSQGFSLTFHITRYDVPATGGLKIGSFDANSNSINFVTSNLGSASTSTPYQVRLIGYTTTDYCGALTNCGSCTVETVCQWCDGACVAAGSSCSTWGGTARARPG